jgi:hypothetical protein
MEAVLYGIVMKVWDDLSDQKLVKEEWIMRSLEYTGVVLQYLLMVSDFNFSIVFYAMNVAMAIFHPQNYSGPCEISYLLLSPIPLIMSYATYRPFTPSCLVIAVVGILGFIIEPYLFPEESSIQKVLARLALSAFYILLLSMGFFEPWVTKLLCVLIGYLLTSSVIQILELQGVLPSRDPELE